VIFVTKVSARFFTFENLKKITAILFVSVYLFSYTELHQLVKIPLLVEHFREHRQEDKNISIWAFLKIHYLEKMVKDSDFDKDQQLPLRDADCNSMAATSICDFNLSAMELVTPNQLPRQFTVYREENKPQFASFDIFQPPRIS
jgi:hypothetical protein